MYDTCMARKRLHGIGLYLLRANCQSKWRDLNNRLRTFT